MISKPEQPRCSHCGSVCGLIFDGEEYVCGDYLLEQLAYWKKMAEAKDSTHEQ